MRNMLSRWSPAGMWVCVVGLALMAWSLVGTPAVASAQATQVKPYFMLILDTSGSMSNNNRDPNSVNGCGYPTSAMNNAKCAITQVVNSSGDAAFGLISFDQPCDSSGSPDIGIQCCEAGADATLTSNDNDTCGIGLIDATIDSAVIRVPISDENENELLSWVDNECASACSGDSGGELWGLGGTPLEGSLKRAQWYYEGSGTGDDETPLYDDPYAQCRPVSVILLTDGVSSNAGEAPEDVAAALRSTTVQLSGGGTITKDILTYVIGFGISPSLSNEVEAIATSGGTDAPGTYRAFYADDETELSLALSQIIADSQLIEVCDSADNDCDSAVDEGFPLFCDRVSGNSTADLCDDPGETVCDGIDDNCDGNVDEGLLNACGECGAEPAEICNGLDDDCDAIIDEGDVCAGCVPSPAEVCDNRDNDCDGLIDEGLSRGCGSDIGECVSGTEVCVTGAWEGCTATGPTPEVCDNLDNNCDGVIDGISRECGMTQGACRAGQQICSMGMWGQCIGQVTAGTEICDLIDNDCDGSVDEADPDLGLGCGTDEGECVAGTIICDNGMLRCDGDTGPTEEVCDSLDNDCDGTPDDGIPVGEACGTDQGACSPGAFVCRDGQIVCEGGVQPQTEVCNNFDDDCDNRIDEGISLGGSCGADEGLCMAGDVQCVDGREVCVGEVPPQREACDCDDNDCDGRIDEQPDSGSLCPSGSACVECQCASPCVGGGEFGPSCPTGKMPQMVGEECYCVAELCNPQQCAQLTIDVGGEVYCSPTSDSVGACVCREGQCTHPCDGRVCADGTVCNPLDPEGRCVEDNCRGLGCPDGQRCNADTLSCETDPCEGVMCPSDQACRDGACEASCASVTCNSGEVCRGGVCEASPCGTTECATGSVCNETTGECQVSRCTGMIRCPNGQACDPLSGQCVTDPCAGLRCPDEQVCEDGQCAAANNGGGGGNGTGDAGTDGGNNQGGGSEGSAIRQVFATGGGGCQCTIVGAPNAHTAGGALPRHGILFSLLVVLGVLLRGRRRRRPAVGSNVRRWVLVFAVLLLAGCDLDPFCLDCVAPPDTSDGGQDGGDGDGGGGADASQGDGAVGDSDASADASTDGAADDGGDGGTCTPTGEEVCNGLDDDCDTLIDEAFDLQTDLNHCGACDAACAPAAAFGACVDGVCTIASCDVGFHDVNQSVDDGCERFCLPESDDDALCDRRDNDCDFTVDEDVDLQNDPDNCGTCGRDCRFAHAGASCVAGACTIGACDEGFYNEDGLDGNGCEYQCTPADPAVEVCNRRDDDCDGDVDEGNPGGGAACGDDEGECVAGVVACVDGAIVCQGAVGPSVETCDGLDNDCDGVVDDGFLNNDINNCGQCGNVCGYDNGVAFCNAGTCEMLSCLSGYWDADNDLSNGCEYACDFSGNEVCDGVDNDCDDVIDEGLTAPSNLCKPNGVCAGTSATCGGAQGWVCNYASPLYEGDVETLCDGVDNNCDGRVDEPFPLVNGACSVGTGACKREGTYGCSMDGANVECSVTTAGTPGVEVCDGVDNDCDGSVDEPKGAPGTNASYVVESMVQVGSVWVYQYEASRPDASASSQGVQSTRACAQPGVLPWTNVTYTEAYDACAAAGLRLCTESEWENACEAGSSCQWSFATNCSTYNANTCNGNDYDAVAGGSDDDVLLTTGALTQCYANTTNGPLYDMSGNAKEWTQARSSGVNPLRGGSYNNTSGGMTCQFNFTVADDSFQLANVGFRCCSDEAP